MTTTPASGAAIQRYKIGYHTDEWGQRSSTPSGIPDTSGSWVRYADHVAALAAGRATAAQAVVPHPAYNIVALSPLPSPDHSERIYGGHGNEIVHSYYTDHQMREYARQEVHRAEAAWQARASHGQAPAGESDGFMEAVNEMDALYEVPPAPATQQAGVALSDDLRDRLVAISEAIADQDDRAAQAMLREILKASQADSVQEDAARYRLLRRGQHWSVVDGTGNDLRAEALDAAIAAARKQGATT